MVAFIFVVLFLNLCFYNLKLNICFSPLIKNHTNSYMGVNSKSEVVCGNQCQCNSNYKKDKVLSDNLFAPIKNKMKVLKKIKKRMGLGMFHVQ